MAYSAEEASPATEVSDSCCICNDEFSSDAELASHLIDHANEEKFKLLLDELNSQKGSKTTTPGTPIRTHRQPAPAFIKTSFVTEPTLRKKPDPKPAEPEVWEIVSDDDEPNNTPNSESKKRKLSNSFRLVSSGSKPNNNSSSEIGPPFHCHSCTSVFSDAVAFQEHLATHDKPRPYVCEICKKSFAYKGTLRQHLHLHIGDKPHECRVCHRKFSIKSVLRKHEETHELHQFQGTKNNT